jgi:CRISPR-associated protein Csc2
MSILENLKSEFHTALPRLASGKYVHFIMLRHSQSFPVFQTDGVLNTTRTSKPHLNVFLDVNFSDRFP